MLQPVVLTVEMRNRLFAVLVVALMVCGSVAGGVGALEITADRAPGVAGASQEAASGERVARATAAAEPTIIGSCTVITESGRYELVGDIENATADRCIQIRASDVVLDGNGHAIDGTTDVEPEALADRFFRGPASLLGQQTDIGVAVEAGRPLSNVTVRNLSVTDWRWGVAVNRVRDARISDVRATDGGFGVTAVQSPRVAVTDSTAVENAVFGVGVFGGPRATIENVTADENGVMGVYLSRVRDAAVSRVSTRDNDLAGVLLDSTRGATIRDVTASGSRFGVYLFGTDESEVTGVTAVEAGTAGIFARNATGTTITDSVATNNDLAGVLLQDTTGVEVTTTNASRSRYGIYLFFADDTRVTDSIANDGVMGVFVRNASDGSVLNNTVLDNSFDGVYVENSTGIRVENNRDGAMTFESTGNESIGKEGGYWHNASIEVNQSDGLSEGELRAYVYRAIGRAEYLRQLEFTGEVSFEVVSEAELQRRNEAEPEDSAATAAWKNQIWEATFVVGEDRNATQVVGNESSRIAGYYNFFADKLVVVSDDDPLTVSSTTLVHELVHALQDQHFDLGRRELLNQARTEDGARARSGLVEGDARYAEERFEQLCGVVWECQQVPSKDPRGGEISRTRNFALRQMLLAPYSDGPSYVAQLRRQGGWQAVDDAYENPLNASEQLIHPDKRNEPPVPLSFEDTARAGWRPFDQSNLSFEGKNGTTTMGEVGIFVMFWYQGYEYDNPIVDVNEHLYPNGGVFDRYNYTSPPSEGWGNDVLVPYRKEGPDETEYGYVWQTEWDTSEDAREFHRAYRQLLRGRGAERVDSNTWVVESGPFADAFRVVRAGTTVTVVNAPTEADLDDLRPGLADGNASETTANETETANDRRPFAAER